MQDLIHSRPLEVQRDNLQTLHREPCLEHIELLMFGLKVARHHRPHRLRARFEADEVRLRLGHMQQHDLAAERFGHLVCDIHDERRDIRKIDGNEYRFHKCLLG